MEVARWRPAHPIARATHIEQGGVPLTFATRKAVVLLAYLAVTGACPTRDTLATLFWPESNQTAAHNALRYTLGVLGSGFKFLPVQRLSIYVYALAVDYTGMVYIGTNHRLFKLGAAQPVAIDINPGSDANTVNCAQPKALIPVAILTRDAFDATSVDHTTVLLEGASESHVNKKSGQPLRQEADTDLDGDRDLVFHFRLSNTSLTCASTQATLIGRTFAGLAITGSDRVTMASRAVNSGEAAAAEANFLLYLPLISQHE